MLNKIGSIVAYGRTISSGCDRPNAERVVGDVDERHDVQGTVNLATDIKLEV